jgi:hypothetical protein
MSIGISTTATFPYACDLLLSTLHCLEPSRSIAEQTLKEFNVYELDHAWAMVREFENLNSLSFTSDFSMSLAYLLFKGVRPGATQKDCKRTLMTLMEYIVNSSKRQDFESTDGSRPIHPDVLGFFLALLPYATNERQLRSLMKSAGCGEKWYRIQEEGPRQDPKEKRSPPPPRIPLSVFGSMEVPRALVMGSFVSMMIKSSHPDGAEATMLFTLLSDLSGPFPEIVSIW